MNSDFKEWLAKTVCPVKESAILGAFSAVRSLGETGLDIEFSLYWSSLEEVSSGEILNDIYTMCQAGLNKVILAHGVEFECSDISKATKFLNVLRMLNDTSDHDAVMQILETDEPDNAMKLALIVEYFRGENHMSWRPHIQRVNDSFIERAIEHHDKPDLVSADMFYLKDQIREFTLIYPGRMLGDALRAGYAPNTPLDYLIANFKKRLIDLAPNNPVDAGLELFGLAILSATSKDGLMAIVVAKLEELYIDIDFVTKVRAELVKIFAEMKLNG